MAIRASYFSSKTTYNFRNPEEQPIEIKLNSGHYLIDCYGAAGGTMGKNGGRGAHVSAYAIIRNSQTFFLYIGSKGSDRNYDALEAPGGFNGGGSGGPGYIVNDSYTYTSGAGGGGATDIRLKSGKWDNVDSLNSRVLVAGGGGGSGFWLKGGAGGKVEGLCSEQHSNCAYFCGGNENNFGFGQDGAAGTAANCGAEGKGGGGGGWYGGLAQQLSGNFTNAAGGGGSSYVSGAAGFTDNKEFTFLHSYIEDGEHSQYSGDGFIVISRIKYMTFSRIPFSFLRIGYFAIFLV